MRPCVPQPARSDEPSERGDSLSALSHTHMKSAKPLSKKRKKSRECSRSLSTQVSISVRVYVAMQTASLCIQHNSIDEDTLSSPFSLLSISLLRR